MEFARTNPTDYNKSTKPMSTDSNKKSSHVKYLFDKLKHDPNMDFQKFEVALQALKAQGADVNKIREVFMDQLDEVRHQAKAIAGKIFDKVGKFNISDAQIVEYVKKQSAKNGLQDHMVEAVTREVAQLVSEVPNRSSFFRFKPYQSTKLSKTLGYSGADSYESVDQTKHPAIKMFKEMDDANKVVHKNLIYQTSDYKDCDINSVTGGFDADKFERFIHIHPVIAALFIPKIKILEEMMLYASISNIVLSRARNEPIATRPEYELFYNMVHDPNMSVCDHKDPLNDLRLRAQIQSHLWKTVLALRTGRYYDPVGNKLLESLNACKYYRYDAPDLMYSGDVSDILRRILMTFSLRTVKVRTLPVMPAHSLNLSTPFMNAELFNGEVDTMPMINIRLGMYNESMPAPRVEHVLRTKELFFEPVSRQIVPKMTEILTANEVLFVNVHRKQSVIPLTRFNGPFTFKDLPLTASENYTLNMSSVVADLQMVLNNEVYDLRSAVVSKISELRDTTGGYRAVPQGTEAIIVPGLFSDVELPNGNYIVYDPLGVNKRLGVAGEILQERPIATYTFNQDGTEQDLAVRIATRGLILVYTKRQAPVL